MLLETNEYRIPVPFYDNREVLDLLPPDTVIDIYDMLFTFEELRHNVFDPIIREILSLIKRQVAQLKHKCDKLLLVGDFGVNEYLLQEIRKRFEYDGTIRKVDTVVDAGLAVMRG